MAPTPHVLVTGASGLLGRYVSAAFAEAGFTVTGADVVAAERPQAPPTVIANLAFDDLSGLFDRSTDVVVHAENVSGTARLMFAALDAGVRPLAVFPVGVRRPYDRAASGHRSLVPNPCDLLKISAATFAEPS